MDESYSDFKQYLIKNFDEYELNKFLKISDNLSDELKIFIKIIEYYNKEVVVPIKMESSSGNVLVFIFKDFVIKLFESPTIFNKETSITQKCSSNKYILDDFGYIMIMNGEIQKNKNILFYDLVNLKFKEDCNLFVSINEKLSLVTCIKHSRVCLSIDINNIKKIMKLFLEIGVALETLHYNKIVHGDCRLDNIGYRNNTFVLFDFNASKIEGEDFYYDINSLYKSVLFHLKIKNDNLIKDFINFIKLSKNGSKLIDNVILFYKEYFDSNNTDYQIYNILASEKIL